MLRPQVCFLGPSASPDPSSGRFEGNRAAGGRTGPRLTGGGRCSDAAWQAAGSLLRWELSPLAGSEYPFEGVNLDDLKLSLTVLQVAISRAKGRRMPPAGQRPLDDPYRNQFATSLYELFNAAGRERQDFQQWPRWLVRPVSSISWSTLYASPVYRRQNGAPTASAIRSLLYQEVPRTEGAFWYKLQMTSAVIPAHHDICKAQLWGAGRKRCWARSERAN